MSEARQKIRFQKFLVITFVAALLVFVLAAVAWAQAPEEIEWVSQFGSPASDGGGSLDLDGDGSLYIAVNTWGALPGQTSAGGLDVALVKHDLDGNVVWIRQFGTSAFDAIAQVSVHTTGVYVVGRTRGSLPGFTNVGWFDAYVRKYDFAGNVVWTRQFGTSDDDFAFGAFIDPTGLLLAGRTSGVFPGQAGQGGIDALLINYDFDGNGHVPSSGVRVRHPVDRGLCHCLRYIRLG